MQVTWFCIMKTTKCNSKSLQKSSIRSAKMFRKNKIFKTKHTVPGTTFLGLFDYLVVLFFIMHWMFLPIVFPMIALLLFYFDYIILHIHLPPVCVSWECDITNWSETNLLHCVVWLSGKLGTIFVLLLWTHFPHNS